MHRGVLPATFIEVRVPMSRLALVATTNGRLTLTLSSFVAKRVYLFLTVTTKRFASQPPSPVCASSQFHNGVNDDEPPGLPTTVVNHELFHLDRVDNSGDGNLLDPICHVLYGKRVVHER